MKNFITLLIFCLPFLFYGQNENGLSFESSSYDFGKITSKTKAKAEFFFTNTSDSPIEILKIHGENHSIEIDSMSRRKYAPNEKGIITLTYDTSCKGPIRKTLTVFTSTKDNTISLKLIGRIED